MATPHSDARINFRLSSDQKKTIEDAARNFYLKFGFRSPLDDPRHLFLPMHEIRKLKLDPI